MSWDEHVMLIAHTVNSFGNRLQVIGNTGSNSTREALHATEQGFAVGMHAALQINPYYGKTSLDGVMAHFSAVMHEGPTIVYNVPSRTGEDDMHPVKPSSAHLQYQEQYCQSRAIMLPTILAWPCTARGLLSCTLLHILKLLT